MFDFYLETIRSAPLKSS